MKFILLLFLSFYIYLQANTLDNLFNKLENTKQENKYKVINQIKLHINKLKSSNRAKAIKQLKIKKFTNMNAHNNNYNRNMNMNYMHVDMTKNISFSKDMIQKLSEQTKQKMKNQMPYKKQKKN